MKFLNILAVVFLIALVTIETKSRKNKHKLHKLTQRENKSHHNLHAIPPYSIIDKMTLPNNNLSATNNTQGIHYANNTNSWVKNADVFGLCWFILVPIVFLIFIMTIISVVGFLILILGSTKAEENLSISQRNINASFATSSRANGLEGINTTDLLEILRLRKEHRRSAKQKKNNYKAEPEPENLVFQF